MRLRRKKDEEPDASETAVTAPPDPEDAAAVATPPPLSSGGESPLTVESSSPGAERPEIIVGAAFVGGFALAQIVKRFAR